GVEQVAFVLPARTADFTRLQATVGVPEQARNVEFFRTARQTIAALGALASLRSEHPRAAAPDVAVATLGVAVHAEGDAHVPHVQEARNIDVLRTRQARVARRAVL